MADDLSLPTRLHPDDLAQLEAAQRRQLAELADAIRNGPFRVPPPQTEVPSGIDARVISEAVRAIVGEKVSSFLTRDQIRDLFDERAQSKAYTDAVAKIADGRLGAIGLRMDDEHIGQTTEDLRGAMKWQRWASNTWWTGVGMIALGALYALARKAGLPVPASP